MPLTFVPYKFPRWAVSVVFGPRVRRPLALWLAEQGPLAVLCCTATSSRAGRCSVARDPGQAYATREGQVNRDLGYHAVSEYWGVL